MAEPWYAAVYRQSYFENFRDEFSADETRQEVGQIVQRLALAPGARVLDLCCGFGRHSLELARRGFDVTGLDLSEFLLEKAQAAAEAEGLNIRWIACDMREIPQPERPYEAVLNLFSSFGFLESDAEEARVVQAVTRVLAPGGRFLIDAVNREIVLRQWMARRWQEKPNGALLAEHLRFDILSGRLHVREVVAHPDGRRLEERTSLRLWAYTELAHLLQDAGLIDVSVWGDLAGSRYTWDSYRMVVCAQRPSPSVL